MDINTLLAPISDSQPTGADARVEPEITQNYYSLKDARTSARAAERSNIFDNTNSEIPEWLTIINQAPQVLCEQTKDLEICCWYTEALIRKEGFSGLKIGFKLIRGLIEGFWEELYPLPDEDGLETRVAPLTGLNGSGAEGVLISPIRNVNLTDSNGHDSYSLWQYQQALEIQKIHDEGDRQSRIDAAGFSLTDIQHSVSDTNDDFFIALVDDLNSCIEDYKAISDLLDQHCGLDISPPSRNIINVLEECVAAIKHLASEVFEAYEIIDTDEDSGDETTLENKKSTVNNGTINSREDAFKQLLRISDFFKKTEPHSPIPAILQRAVKWGNMPIEQLIQELIPDNSSREHFRELTGVINNDD